MAETLGSHALNLLEILKDAIENNRLAEVKETIEDLLISRVNLAVVGDRGPEKAALLNALRGLGPQDEGAAQCPSPTMPDELAVYPSPKHPDYRLWDLPPVPVAAPFDRDAYMEKVKFMRYNVVIFAFGGGAGVVGANAVAVFKEARAQQSETVYFVLLASEKETQQSLEDRRNISLDVLKAEGVALPKVHLVRPRALETLDFPNLLDDMGRDLPEIRAQALILALPALTTTLVGQKRDAFQVIVYASASLSGGVSAIPVPFVASMVDASVGVRVLTNARESLCLDDVSLERLAQQRGVDLAKLKALRTCNLSIEVTKGEVKKRLAVKPTDEAGYAEKGARRLAAMAIPRNARNASNAFNAMLQALNGAIEEMAADAEKILAATTCAEVK